MSVNPNQAPPEARDATVLSLGDQSSSTKLMQVILRGAHLYNGPVDGKFTDDYERAMLRWQDMHGLVKTGHVDYATSNFVAQIMGGISGHAPAGFATITDDLRKEVTARYGAGFLAYLNSPIGQMIVDNAKKGNDKGILFGQLSKTSYWKNLSDSARGWDQLKVTNPGEATAQLAASERQINQMAGSLGLKLDSKTLLSLSDNAIRYGWLNADANGHSQIKDVLVNTIATTGKFNNTGDYSSVLQGVKAAGANYLIDVSDQTAATLAAKMIKGETDDAALKAGFAAQAKAMFPTMKAAIDAGTDPHTILDPYRQVISRELDMSPDKIDFIHDSRWRKLLNFDPDGTGKHNRLATTDEALNVARQDPAWWSSTNGRAQSAQTALAVGKSFGAIA